MHSAYMALIKRVESGCKGLSLPPNAQLEKVRRENERKQSASVYPFMVSLMSHFCGRQHHKVYPPLSVQIEAVA